MESGVSEIVRYPLRPLLLKKLDRLIPRSFCHAVRLAISRCVALETTRSWRIAKEKASHKIDVVVAMAQAALGAVLQGAQSGGAIGAGEMLTMPTPRFSPRWRGTEPASVTNARRGRFQLPADSCRDADDAADAAAAKRRFGRRRGLW